MPKLLYESYRQEPTTVETQMTSSKTIVARDHVAEVDASILTTYSPYSTAQLTQVDKQRAEETMTQGGGWLISALVCFGQYRAGLLQSRNRGR